MSALLLPILAMWASSVLPAAASGAPFVSGPVTLPTGGFDRPTAFVPLPDGRMVVAGGSFRAASDFLLVRILPDLRGDPDFGANGIVLSDVGASDEAYTVARMADGRIVAAGTSCSPFVPGECRFAIARYLSDGTPDPTFGTDGIVTSDVGRYAEVRALALEEDGTVVAGGRVCLSNGPEPSECRFAIARYSVSGALDASFGAGGLVLTDVGSGAEVHAVHGDGAGRLLAIGVGGDRVVLARYSVDGDLDGDFGQGGIARHVLLERPLCEAAGARHWPAVMGFTVAPDGFVVTGADCTTCPVGTCNAVRLALDGEGRIRPAFGRGGRQSLRSRSVRFDVAVQADGRLVMLSDRLERYQLDGSIDESFGERGSVSLLGFHAEGEPVGFSMLGVDSEDRIVLAGERFPGPDGSPLALAQVRRHPVCGDGIVDPGEACDAAAGAADGCCTATCSVPAGLAGVGCTLRGLSVQGVCAQEYLPADRVRHRIERRLGRATRHIARAVRAASPSARERSLAAAYGALYGVRAAVARATTRAGLSPICASALDERLRVVQFTLGIP